MSETAIEFRLLGPLEVWRDGHELAVGGANRHLLGAGDGGDHRLRRWRY